MKNIDITQQNMKKISNHSPHLPDKDLPLSKKIDFLKSKIVSLENLCLNVDPYQPISESNKLALKEFYITDFYDPFAITNKLLLLLDEASSELKILENL